MFTLVLAGVVVLVVIGKAGAEVLTAAGVFICTVFGCWRYGTTRPGQQDDPPAE